MRLPARAMTAIPPTTPPAIAPLGVDDLEDAAADVVAAPLELEDADKIEACDCEPVEDAAADADGDVASALDAALVFTAVTVVLVGVVED